MTAHYRVTAKPFALTVVCVAALALEIYLVFISRHGVFRIEGEDTYDLTGFGSGAVVAHSFLMRGDGLNSVAVRLGSDARAQVKVQWTLWRGTADQPRDMTLAFEGSEVIDLRPGHQWKTVSFTRDASSRDRWYTIEVRSLAIARAEPAPTGGADTPPQIVLVASHDNPERGGVLWVNGVRQPGSLFMQAGRQGRTLHRRFVAEVEPNLPPLLRIRAVQWLLALASHWAFLVFAWAAINDGDRRS